MKNIFSNVLLDYFQNSIAGIAEHFEDSSNLLEQLSLRVAHDFSGLTVVLRPATSSRMKFVDKPL